MSLVLDCSVTLSWYLPDEHDDGSIAVADHVADNGAVVPFHWRAEMANGLLTAMRRGRIAAGFIERAFRQFDALPVSTDLDGLVSTDSEAVTLAVRHGLSVYDAIYLETAHRRRLPLATLDKALARAAQASGVALFGLPAR